MVAERALTQTGPRTIADPREEEQLTRQLILKNATEPQLKLVMGICNRYGFDPLLKHVVIVSNNIYVTRDGLLHLAHASGQFDGIGVEMSQTKNGEWVATCTVHRKDMRHPIIYTAFESEHKPSNPNGSAWAKYPRAMLQKCAEVMALRRAFDVSVGAAEEIGYDAPSGHTEHGQARFVETTVREVPPAQIAAPAKQATPSVENKFVATVRQMGQDGVTVKEISEFINSEWDNVTEAEQFASTEALDAIKATRRTARMAKLQQPAAPIEATVVETPAPADEFGWTEVWSWLRARGINSRKDIDATLGKPSTGMTIMQIKAALEEIEEIGQAEGLSGLGDIPNNDTFEDVPF